MAFLFPVLAYLIGSIPFGYLIARAKGIDIRTKGSGNIGATNVGRVLGRKWGFLCFFLDFLKGFVPAAACGVVLARGGGTGLSGEQTTLLYLGTALCAVLGHMFPVWLKFKGGKGIATGFGALLGVWPVFTIGAVIAIVVWVALVKITRMIGISSVLAGVALAAWVVASWLAPSSVQEALSGWRVYRQATWVEGVFALVLCALVVYKHRGNIARTMAGTEPKIGKKTATVMNASFVERLRSVPWGRLKTASGNAGSVPDAILELMSANASVRKAAYWRIDNHVVLQSSLHESACWVPRFLIEVLEAKPLHGRAEIYDLLYEIGTGHAPPEEEVVLESGEVKPLGAACRIAVRQGVAVFNRDLKDPDSCIREKATELLDALRENESGVG